MGKKEEKKAVRRKWPDDKMKAALDLIEEGRLMNSVSKNTGIPRQTL